MTSKRPISDSPWFWMLVYSGWTFVALALLSLKYGSRQSQLERQFQGRMVAAEKDSPGSSASHALETPPPGAEGHATNPPADASQFSTAQNTIIALWPLTFIFFGLAVCGGVMLWRERRGMEIQQEPITASS
jgi:hypothetical protein